MKVASVLRPTCRGTGDLPAGGAKRCSGAAGGADTGAGEGEGSGEAQRGELARVSGDWDRWVKTSWGGARRGRSGEVSKRVKG